MMRKSMVIGRGGAVSKGLAQRDTDEPHMLARVAVNIPPMIAPRLRVCGPSREQYRAYVLHPRSLELAPAMPATRRPRRPASRSCSGRECVVSRVMLERASRTKPVRFTSSGGLMRKPPRDNAWVMVACATITLVSPAHAQQVQPYGQTMQFGVGYINTPAAWISRRTADSWLTLSAKDLPSFGDPSKNGLASRLNTNFALDTHWGGRVSLGASLYSQNPEWGAFGQ